MKKKALSILLILCMVMSMLPVMGISAFVVPVEGATGNTVYIDGAWGGKGNDTNTGEDKDYPVKTLQKALELAGAGGTIYACGEIQQLGTLENDTIDISNVTFKRAEDFTKNIIDVNWFGGGKLTINLSNVIFDGEGKDVNRYSGGELITVTGAVVLNMNEGTQLINNQDSAIQVASGATLNMKGGVIKNNHAERKSGGITIWHGDVNLTGGEISNNSTLDCGGGIQAIGECNIVLDKEKNNEGVVIKENSAVYGGGGVYLEGRKASNQYNPVTLSFTMNNGSIISNHALSWEESYDGDTWENYSPGGGIFAFKHDYDETVVTINGGTIKENTTMEEDYGAAMVFKNNQRGQYGFPQLKMSGSPDISGDVLFFDEETVGPVVEVTAEFTPVNPVPLISNYGSEGTTVVTYAQGLSPENSKEQFVSVVKSMGLLANAQNLEWVELNRVDFIWGNATNDRKRVYVYPDNPVLESDAPAPTLTGYTLDGWVCYGEYVKWDFDTIIKGTTSLYSIWKLNAPTVTVTADKEAAHFDDVITLTATASHALGGGVTYSYQWYKDGAAIDSANTQYAAG